jgi:hypothetical protein
MAPGAGEPYDKRRIQKAIDRLLKTYSFVADDDDRLRVKLIRTDVQPGYIDFARD